MAPKKRLGELLIEAGLIDEAMLQSALGHQRRWGGRLGHALLDLKLTSEVAVVAALARKLGFEPARLGALEPQALESALKLVGKAFATRHGVFPMAADHATLTVAMSDPTNLAISDELRFRTNRRIKVLIGGDREIAEAIRSHYPEGETQQLEAISLDSEVSGEFLPPLADPFGGGSSEALDQQMQRGQRHLENPEATPSAAVRDARAELFGAVPHGGFSPRDGVEELALTPLPLQAGPATPPAWTRPAQTPVPGAHPAHTPVPGMHPAHTPVAWAAGPAPTSVPPPPGVEAVLEEELVEGRIPLRPLTPKEIVVLDALERLAAGQEDVPLPVKPSQVAAALLRIMLRKRIVTQQELLDELLRR
jgi:type IV pilus assembly protein PilB